MCTVEQVDRKRDRRRNVANFDGFQQRLVMFNVALALAKDQWAPEKKETKIVRTIVLEFKWVSDVQQSLTLQLFFGRFPGLLNDATHPISFSERVFFKSRMLTVTKVRAKYFLRQSTL